MTAATEAEEREAILSPVDRVSEMLFGLFMALTFVGAVSVATPGRDEIRTMFFAALGCNLAWGLVDAVMYVVRGVVDRGRMYTLARNVRGAADAETGRRHVERALSGSAGALLTPTETEAIRARIFALPAPPEKPTLRRQDALAALGIFLIVVASTFPVVLPFVFIADATIAKHASRVIALAMLFVGGLALGRYAGYGGFRTGFIMMALGTALVAAVMALGG